MSVKGAMLAYIHAALETAIYNRISGALLPIS